MTMILIAYGYGKQIYGNDHPKGHHKCMANQDSKNVRQMEIRQANT